MHLPGTAQTLTRAPPSGRPSSVNTLSHLSQSGSVRCLRASCPPPLCSHPVINACGCPACEGKRLTLLSAEVLKSKGEKKRDVSPLGVGCHYQGLTYGDGQSFPGEDGCRACTCSVRERTAALILFNPLRCLNSLKNFFPPFYFLREVKLCVHSRDARLCRAHTLPWMAVPVASVTVAVFMGEAVPTENNSPVLSTAASSAPVRYCHSAVLMTDPLLLLICHFFLFSKAHELSNLGGLKTCRKILEFEDKSTES